MELRNLTKDFAGAGSPRPALRDVNLKVERGELVVILGPSGSGKSTLLRLIAGLEKAGRGEVLINGTVVNEVPPERRNVAMVFQNHALYPHMTVSENLALPLVLRNVRQPEVLARVKEMAALLGLEDCLRRTPAQLSGGERQRVGVGRALIRRPDVLLLDEPLSNLDAPLRAQLRAEIMGLHATLATTTLYVTHDQEEAMALGNRLAVLSAGELQQIGPAIEVYRRPANRFVAGFVGTPPMNQLAGRLVRRNYTLYFEPDSIAPVPAEDAIWFQVADEATAALTGYLDKPVILGLRPEAVRLASDREIGTLKATVRRVEQRGAGATLELSTRAGQLTMLVSGETALEQGSSVSLRCEMDQAQFFDPTNGLGIRAG